MTQSLSMQQYQVAATISSVQKFLLDNGYTIVKTSALTNHQAQLDQLDRLIQNVKAMDAEYVNWKPNWSDYPDWVRYIVWMPSGFIYLYENKPNDEGRYSGTGRWFCESIEPPENRLFEKPTT